jgi:hypothetical protein
MKFQCLRIRDLDILGIQCIGEQIPVVFEGDRVCLTMATRPEVLLSWLRSDKIGTSMDSQLTLPSNSLKHGDSKSESKIVCLNKTNR